MAGIDRLEFAVGQTCRKQVWIVACPSAEDGRRAVAAHLFGKLSIVGAYQPEAISIDDWERETCAQASATLDAGERFAMLSTLRTESCFEFIARAKAAAYRVGLAYICSLRDGIDTSTDTRSSLHYPMPEHVPIGLGNLGRVSRCVDELALLALENESYNLIGHAIDGLPKELHPFPTLLERVRIPGLAITEDLRQDALRARARVLKMAEQIERESGGRANTPGTIREELSEQATGLTSSPRQAGSFAQIYPSAPSALRLRHFLKEGESGSTISPMAIETALSDLPEDQTAIQDWCDRLIALDRLNRSI